MLSRLLRAAGPSRLKGKCNLESSEILRLVIAVLTGGAAGAIITQATNAYRSRVQPVGYRMLLDPVLRPAPDATNLRAKVTIEQDGQQCQFDNLFRLRITITNRGNHDLPEFKFGITADKGDMVIWAEAEGPDRHHTITDLTGVGPMRPCEEVDFCCSPFNRGDTYQISLFMVAPAQRSEPSMPQLSSPVPVKFTEMPTIGEIMRAALVTSATLAITRGNVAMSIQAMDDLDRGPKKPRPLALPPPKKDES